jgi:hypothetical protein
MRFASTEYVPAAAAAIVNRPSSSVRTVRRSDEPRCTSATSTPATGWPLEESRTTPRTT